MRFVSKPVGGYRIYAVSGVNTVSFGIDFEAADTAGLLGFAIEREDPVATERYYVFGFKVFESVVPKPTEDTQVKTYDQPVQSFVWDDFTCKPGQAYTYWFHPLKGKAKNLDRSAAPIRIKIETEPLFTTDQDDVFFNRGVASSQAYVRRFDNLPPDKITDPVKRQEALQWLSRDLDEALLKFIDDTPTGDTLLGCFYEFRYLPALLRLKAADERGVKVRLIVDAKINETVDKKGVLHESFPRVANMKAVRDTQMSEDTIALWRENNSGAIQHNKFMVRLKGEGDAAEPIEVWSGSTNLSMGGIHGQTNVGHWVRDAGVARAFTKYWNFLLRDPGAEDGESEAERRADNKKMREGVAALGDVPATWDKIAPGETAVFSPRSGLAVLDMYFEALDEAGSLGCITLAFGINAALKAKLVTHTAASGLTFMLLEKRDKPDPDSKTPFVKLDWRQNVYQAWGSFLRDAVYQWARETNAKLLDLNEHVSYIHSKFLLKDPLGDDPIVVTGSANFSANSTNDNDENMLLIRGNRRVADIYFTEFNRLFFHYYFRSVQEATFQGGGDAGTSDPAASLFLRETDEWLAKYKPGSLKTKRVEMFAKMAGAVTLE